MGSYVVCFCGGVATLLVGMAAGVFLILFYKERMCRPPEQARTPRHAPRRVAEREERYPQGSAGRSSTAAWAAWNGEENAPRGAHARRHG